MPESINREAFKKSVEERYCKPCKAEGKVSLDWILVGDAADAACRVIDNVPTVDAVVVTRCKDCKHYDMGVCLKIYSDGNMNPEAWQPRKPDDFCSYGKRRDKP